MERKARELVLEARECSRVYGTARKSVAGAQRGGGRPGEEAGDPTWLVSPSGALSVREVGACGAVQSTVASASFGRVALATGDGSRGA